MFNIVDDCVGVVVRQGSKEHCLIALYKADPQDPTRNIPTLTVYEVADNGLPKATSQTPHLRKVTRESASGAILGIPVVAVLRPAAPAQTALKLAETAPADEAPKPETPKGKGK